MLIEPRTWLRECLAYALEDFLPEMAIEAIGLVSEVTPGPAALFLIGVDPRSADEMAYLPDRIEALRGLGEGAPIAAYLHSNGAEIVASLTAMGVAGVILPDSGVKIAVAAVRLMAAGGIFRPVIVRAYNEEIVAEPSPVAPQRSPPSPPPPQPPASESPLAASLTPREREVLVRLRAGRANKTIAFDLQISEGTVKAHLRSIMAKLNATNRTQAAVRFGASQPVPRARDDREPPDTK
ncbi:MAG TPA: response regulator transcription factor [Roseiarcus sp.]